MKSRPFLSKWDFVLVLVPALIWWGANDLQSRIIQTPCNHQPDNCRVQDLFWFDRPVVPMDNQRAADLSNHTQDFSGYVSGVVPIALSFAAVASKAVAPAAGALTAVTDLTILLETMLWNGAATETTRVIVQRPRPYVYRDPLSHAGSPAHYTSFYSGHTSFAASITLGMVFVLMSRGITGFPMVAAVMFSVFMTVLTGILRMLGGKHFTSDVVVAAFAGAAVAWIVARLHRRAKPL